MNSEGDWLEQTERDIRTEMEAGVNASYARVCTEDTIPFARGLAEKAVPHTQRIVEASRRLVGVPAQA